MDDNFKNDYSLLEQDTDVFDSKIKKQKKVSMIFLFIVGIIIAICFIYRDNIKNIISSSNTITITSKDGTQKMSLMNKDIKYRGPNSCPKLYHIPTMYEWIEIFKLWCENHHKCNTKDIDTNSDFGGWGTLYYGSDEVVDDFFHDFNIHLNRDFDFDIGFHKEKYLGVDFNCGFVCESLSFSSDHGDKYISIEPQPFDYNPKRCRKPEYVRCFSDENLTPEFIYEEDFKSKYGLEHTEFEIDGISYSGWKIRIGSTREDIVIPESYEGIPIIEVGDGGHGFTSVKLGKNIIKIDDNAFRDNQIKEIEISDSVIYIGKDAFLNNQLTSITIPDSVVYIGENAFFDNQLTSITIPNNVKFIGNGAFSHNKISSFQLPDGLKVIPDFLFTNNNLEILNIPDGIEIIGNYAFLESNIKQLNLPPTIQEIGSYAFSRNNLTELALPQSVKIIGTYAFSNNNLTEISLPKSMETIGDLAFSCNNLTEILLPKSIETIGNLVFCGNGKDKVGDFSGNCLENGYVTIKGYPKNSNTCININPFTLCQNEKENKVCGEYGRAYRNTCYMKARGDKEGPNYEYIDGRCRLKED